MALLQGVSDVKYLYKFRPANEHTIDNLAHQRLRFSYPKEFNDPFDCAVRREFSSGTKQDWDRWLDELKLPLEDRQNFERYLASVGYDGREMSGVFYSESINNSIVLALSESNDNILLWSHYAQNHEGICIGFRTRIEGDSLGLLFDEPSLTWNQPGISEGFLQVEKVTYSLKMPEPFNSLRDPIRKCGVFLTTKHVDWKYEAEWRIILPRSYVDGQFLSYDKSTLAKIIFGYRIDNTFRQRVRDILRDNYTGIAIEFYQCRPKEGEYSLVIDRLN